MGTKASFTLRRSDVENTDQIFLGVKEFSAVYQALCGNYVFKCNKYT